MSWRASVMSVFYQKKMAPGHALTGFPVHDGAMNEEEIISYMTSRGWAYGETTVINQHLVTFTRHDWHGRPIRRPFVVSRYGMPEERAAMVREAARQALTVWQRFVVRPPERFWDERRRALVWSVRPSSRPRVASLNVGKRLVPEIGVVQLGVVPAR